MRLAYLHLARFPIQRRVLETPSLAGRPVVLTEEDHGVRRVVFTSTAARKAGIRVGLTLTAATALEPSLAAFPHQPQAEREALSSLGEALMVLSPGFELSAPEGLWLDAQAAKLSGGEEGFCRRALQICVDHGYRAHVALASQRFTARAVAQYGERRIEVVDDRSSAAALAPLPLSALGELAGAFRPLGLTSLGEMAGLPPGAVVARLGAAGLKALKLCRGEDDTLLTAQPLPEQLVEQINLDWPADAMEPLLFAVKTTLDRLCARLAGRRRAAVRVTCTLKLDPSGQAQVVLQLARPTAQVKLLLELVRHRIADLTLDNPIGALVVRVDEACDDPGQQLALGDEPTGDAALEVVLSRLSTTLGEEALFCAEPAPVHRPEAAYRTSAFHPPKREPALFRELLPLMAKDEAANAASVVPADPTSLERPARLFVRPSELVAEVGQKGQILGARLSGKRRKATAVAGPERLAGDWWADSPYTRDYYRVHFEGVGPVWIYRDARDGRFYLQGMFD